MSIVSASRMPLVQLHYAPLRRRWRADWEPISVIMVAFGLLMLVLFLFHSSPQMETSVTQPTENVIQLEQMVQRAQIASD